MLTDKIRDFEGGDGARGHVKLRVAHDVRNDTDVVVLTAMPDDADPAKPSPGSGVEPLVRPSLLCMKLLTLSHG